MKLKKRTVVAKRGHKLLKDKLDEVMKPFLDAVRKGRALREQVEEKLAQAHGLFTIARSQVLIEVIEEALFYPRAKVAVEISTGNLIGVIVPEMELRQEGTFDCYSLSYTLSEVFYELKKLRLVTSSSGRSYLTEVSKKQRMLYEKFGVPVPTMPSY